MKSKPFYLSDEHTRSFGGKLTGFESRDEAIREKKHLKAYLKGNKVFTHLEEVHQINPTTGEKIESVGNTMKVPTMYEVKEIWTPKNN